jgi:hypothetical protein
MRSSKSELVSTRSAVLILPLPRPIRPEPTTYQSRVEYVAPAYRHVPGFALKY